MSVNVLVAVGPFNPIMLENISTNEPISMIRQRIAIKLGYPIGPLQLGNSILRDDATLFHYKVSSGGNVLLHTDAIAPVKPGVRPPFRHLGMLAR